MRPLPLELYRIAGFFLYPLARLAVPLMRFVPGRIAYGLPQRLGLYDLHSHEDQGMRPALEPSDLPTVWVHAASVGEVQAALLVLAALRRDCGGYRYLLTTTTQQGHALAQERLPQDVPCLMAPLDVPQALGRALAAIQPCLYLCLETELWPLLLCTLHERRVPMLLLNGRLSERSLKRYLRIRASMAAVLRGFHRLALLSQADKERFARLGVAEERMTVAGNIKFDLPLGNAADEVDQANEAHGQGATVRAVHRARLGLGEQEEVLVCGSTHGGEEALLLPVFRELASAMPLVLVLAPRHLERLEEVESLLRAQNMDYEHYSRLQGKRRVAVVLVDTMGDLADLYSAGDFLFCGGSLLPRLSGHNVMEAARWGRPVYFGPHMKDWQGAADMLRSSGGGFQVQEAAELAALIAGHAASPELYTQTCRAARETAASQRGALARQMAIVHEFLKGQGGS